MNDSYLISSHNDPQKGKGHNKMPGLSLIRSIVKGLKCNYLFIPSSPSSIDTKKSIIRNIRFIIEYFKASLILLWLLLSKKKVQFVFYNFPKAYLPIYLIILIRGRPNLILADGLNCYGLQKLGSHFFSLFNKIISLPVVDNSRFSGYIHKIIWMPGLISNDLIKQNTTNKSLNKYLIYNSAPFKHNGPDLLIKEGGGLGIKIKVTDTKDNFLKISGINPNAIPTNLEFVGQLDWNNYLSLMNESEGILLVRDESNFANKFNFPSKVIEALVLGVPIYSRFLISGLDSSLYIKLLSLHQNNSTLAKIKQQYVEEFSTFSKKQFLRHCDLPSAGDFFT